MRFMNFIMLSYFSKLCKGFSKPISKSPITEDHLKIANMCKDVYSNEVDVLDTFVESKDTGIQATVGIYGKRAIVCFRGSSEVKDWKINLNMGKVPFLSRKHIKQENRVHSGFFIGHNSVKAKIYQKLNNIVNSGECESILFCGHSQAATLSILSAFDYVNTNDMPISVVTFGSPRIGNKSFADDFDAKIKCTRIVNDRDVVTTAPFQFMKFYHVGDVIRLKNGDVFTGDSGFFKRASLRIMGVFSFDFGIRDHNMSKYIEEIESNLKKYV